MREFLLFLLIATATADRMGYDYESNRQIATFGSDGYITSGIGNGIGLNTDIKSIGIADTFSSGFSGFNSFNDITSDTFSQSNINGFSGNSESDNQYTTKPVDSEYFKEFYSYTAPDDDINEFDGATPIANVLKKNLRVIFIKAPENQALTNAALKLAQQASEDRTAIYVLTKQTDVSELANRLQAVKASNAHKPEVHFVKYRTPEDALHAQQVIQAQFDTLAGQTLSSNEGIAPVLDFTRTSATKSAASNVAHSGATDYLPPTLLRAYR